MNEQLEFNRIVSFNEDTKEVVGITTIKADGTENFEGKAVKLKKPLTAKQKAFINKQSDFKSHCNSLGGFIHMIYAKNEILFNDLNIDKANISRIIYLATYMDYTQKGLIVLQPKSKDGKFLQIEPMTKKVMQTTLNLGDTAFKKFLKDMKDNSLIYEVDKKYYINTDYFIKGEVENIDKAKQNYCRLFIDTIRNLYEGCKSTKHKVLSNAFQLIPYIHYEHNIICHNPNEVTETPKALTLNEICELLKIDSTNSSKLAKQLYEFKVTANGVEYHLFSYVILNAQYDYFVVNPLVIYSGNSLDSINKTSKALFFNEYTHRQKRK